MERAAISLSSVWSLSLRSYYCFDPKNTMFSFIFSPLKQENLSLTALVTCTCSSTLSNYAKSLMFINFVVLLFQVMEKCEN